MPPDAWAVNREPSMDLLELCLAFPWQGTEKSAHRELATTRGRGAAIGPLVRRAPRGSVSEQCTVTAKAASVWRVASKSDSGRDRFTTAS